MKMLIKICEISRTESRIIEGFVRIDVFDSLIRVA